MLTENDVTNLLEQYFINRNYEIVQKLTTKQTGVDLIVRDINGQELYIEVKGETSANEKSARYNLPFNGNQIWNHGSVALMKTLELMSLPENSNIKFAIGVPKNHETMFKKIKTALDKLDISVYFVSMEKIEIL